MFFTSIRSVPKGSHPIETGRYLIATNEVDKMFSKVSQWIENRSPGGIIYGRPRIGKTRAILYLMHILPTEFGAEIPIFQINCKKHSRPNEGIFYEEILSDLGHGLSNSGKPNIKRDRIIKYFLERGEASEQNRIIVFMDDAQRLVELQYGWLMDIYNDLDRSGISMTVILIGQEELLHQRSAFVQSKKAQIVGRFMVHEHQFIGIKSIADLKICLRGYDEDCEYPEGTGWSFTKFFFPDDFSDGFRLENCAHDLFEAWINIRNQSGFKRPIEIQMQYFTLTIEYALRKFGINGLGCHSITSIQGFHNQDLKDILGIDLIFENRINLERTIAILPKWLNRINDYIRSDLTFCNECMSFGHHSIFYQIKFITSCPSCGSKIPYELNDKFTKSPFKCLCGYSSLRAEMTLEVFNGWSVFSKEVSIQDSKLQRWLSIDEETKKKIKKIHFNSSLNRDMSPLVEI